MRWFLTKYKKLELKYIQCYYEIILKKVGFNLHWLQNLEKNWIIKVKSKFFWNRLVKMVLKSAFSLENWMK